MYITNKRWMGHSRSETMHIDEPRQPEGSGFDKTEGDFIALYTAAHMEFMGVKLGRYVGYRVIVTFNEHIQCNNVTYRIALHLCSTYLELMLILVYSEQDRLEYNKVVTLIGLSARYFYRPSKRPRCYTTTSICDRGEVQAHQRRSVRSDNIALRFASL